jgi:predicted membrane-bound mannosyltransferase
VVKFAYLQERLAFPDVSHPTMDSLFHDEWARGLAFGDWSPRLERIRDEPYFRAPLYPHFVAATYRLLGPSPGALFAVQHVLGALTAVLIFLYGALFMGRKVGWVAALLCIGYWPFTYHESERLIPALVLLLNAGFLLLLGLAIRSRRWAFYLSAGLV